MKRIKRKDAGNAKTQRNLFGGQENERQGQRDGQDETKSRAETQESTARQSRNQKMAGRRAFW
jgi:hypothetical protein